MERNVLSAAGGNGMKSLPLASKVLYNIWRPDTYIKNGRKSYLHKLTMPNILLRVRDDGEVYVSQRCAWGAWDGDS
jgi:gamma-aminobutyric acid receptor subunit alpha